MSDNRLHTFVEKALVRGVSGEEIRAMLREAKWSEGEIEAALGAWVVAKDGVPVPRPRPSLAAGDTFMYLLMFATFVMGATGLLDILFALINKWVPPVDGYANYDTRFGVAALLVSFPVYAFLYAMTSRAARNDADRRDSPARRWLIYLTLFVTAVTTLGGLASLVIGFLDGNGDVNAGVKIALLVTLSMLTFANYLWELRRTAGRAGTSRRAFVTAAVALILSTLFAGGSLAISARNNRTYDYYRNGKPAEEGDRFPEPAPETKPVPTEHSSDAGMPPEKTP